jgi:hypothetical protein
MVNYSLPVLFLQDDGEAGIALVGVHSDYPKYTEDMKKDDKTSANVG